MRFRFGLAVIIVGMAFLSLEARELPLSEAITIALSQHPDVRQAELQLSLAELQLEAARAKGSLPSLSFTLTPPGLTPGGLSTAQGTLGASLSLPWGTSSQLSAGLGVGWDGGTWGISGWSVSGSFTLDLTDPTAAASELEDLEEAVQEARESLEETKNAKVLEVISAYIDLLSLKAQVDQAQTAQEKAQKELEEVQESVAAGLAGDLDLLEARLAVLEAQIALEERVASFAAKKAQFLQDLGLKEDIELVPLDLPAEELKEAAEELLSKEELLVAAVDRASGVKAALNQVEEAQEALRKTHAAGLPTFTVQAGLTGDGFNLGWQIAFDLFSPDRGTDVEIAQKQLELAEIKLEAARKSATQNIQNLQESLKAALRDLDRLPLEEEKLALKEQVMRAKHEAGAISDEDWQDFLEEKEAFLLEAGQRLGDLLIAYLTYRDALGLSLDWEGWLR